jgi:hypothetical protein
MIGGELLGCIAPGASGAYCMANTEQKNQAVPPRGNRGGFVAAFMKRDPVLAGLATTYSSKS